MTAPTGIERVLVTGASGLIGRSVTRRLAADGTAVTAHLGPPGLAGSPPGHAWIDDYDAVLALVGDTQAVVHLAGPPSVAGSFRDPVGYARAHCLGTATVLAACQARGVRRIVHVSSAEIYGRPIRNPVTEDAPFAPRSPYAAMKVAAEDLLRTGLRPQGPDVIVLRPFSVIGLSVSPQSVLGTILRQALDGCPVRLHAPEIVRDFVAADDVADAVATALHAPAATPFRAYNVGSGVGTSVRALAATILTILGKPAMVEQTAGADRAAAVDIPELVADPRRAARELGWTARTPLPEALHAAVRGFAQHDDRAAACAS